MTDNDILDYLMTSEFNEGLSDQEAQFLLLKFRQFYRIQVSKQTQQNHKYDELEKESTESFNLLQEMYNQMYIDNEVLKRKNKTELERKLTFKERITGKIKRNNDNEIR